MKKLMQSIGDRGVDNPIIVFSNEEGQLEIVSGHRRCKASELLGRDTVPALIKHMTRDEAIIVMGESNLTSRERILPSEKAFTYKEMFDALKRQGQRTDLTSGPVDPKLKGKKTREIIAEKGGDSDAQVKRYMRLTYLIPELLDLVDEKRIGMRPAEELSYLPANLQICIYDYCELEDRTPSHAQTKKFRELYTNNLLDEAKIADIMKEDKPNQKEPYKLSKEIIDKFFRKNASNIEIENRLYMALELLTEVEGGKDKNKLYDEIMVRDR